MGFFDRKPKTEQCPMCDATVLAEDSHRHLDSHVVIISADGPAWLPQGLRSVAVGEYTFKCDRCNSYPSIKWPSDGGASAGMVLHLGRAHGKGQFAHMSAPVNFDMIKIS